MEILIPFGVYAGGIINQVYIRQIRNERTCAVYSLMFESVAAISTGI